METKYIIVIILILLILFLLYKNNEHLTLTDTSSEAIQNVAKIYADASGTATFNNIRLNNIILNNDLDISGHTTFYGPTDIIGYDLNVIGVVNATRVGGRDIKYNGVDIRQWLIGCVIHNQKDSRQNTGYLLNLYAGDYNFTGSNGETVWNNMIDIIVVYPGFVVEAWKDEFSGEKVTIINADNLPLRVKTGSVVYDNGNNPSRYKIEGSFDYNEISSIKVSLLDENLWMQHKPS